MKNIPVILICLSTGLFLSGCGKSPLCSDKDENKGIISKSIAITCWPSISGDQFVIESDSAYQNLFEERSNGCTLPEIDFNQYTLLGSYADGTCNVRFIREVKQQESENRYKYSVIAKDCGKCMKLELSYNWVTVPKLPAGWTVDFEVRNE